jgi:hypothetical protein
MPFMEDVSAFAALGMAMALGLAACVATNERPLPPDHPASPTAAEAPRQPLRYALGPDAESARTRQLLTNAGHQDRPPPQKPGGQSPAGSHPERPAMTPGYNQP